MSNQLIPCPFCGSTELRYGKYATKMDGDWRDYYQVECKLCAASGPRTFEFQDDAARLWNEAFDKLREVYEESAAWKIGSAIINAK